MVGKGKGWVLVGKGCCGGGAEDCERDCWSSSSACWKKGEEPSTSIWDKGSSGWDMSASMSGLGRFSEGIWVTEEAARSWRRKSMSCSTEDEGSRAMVSGGLWSALALR